MAKSLNEVRLLGNLGADAEVKYTAGGIAVASLSIATTRRVKRNEEWVDETDWHRVTLWRCEKIAEYLKRGTRVCVSGRLQTRSFDKDGEKRYVTEVVAEDVILLGGKSDGGDAPVSRPRPAPRTGGSQPFQAQPDIAPGVTDDDVPF